MCEHMNKCESCAHYCACANLANQIGAETLFKDFQQQRDCKEFQSKDATLWLPCDIGATLYEITPNQNIWTRWVEGYHINTAGKKQGAYLIINDGMGMHSRINVNKLGKTVFYTRTAAEAATSAIECEVDES